MNLFGFKFNKKEESLEDLVESCSGDMWLVMREYKKRHPEKSIRDIRRFIGVDDKDLDIKDAWNDELFFKVWGKPRTEVNEK